MKIGRIAALAVFLATPVLGHGQAAIGKNDKAAQEVIDFRNRYIEAEENRDTAFLDKILADDFFALNPQGKLLDKAGQLENLKRPDRTLKVLNARETHVQFYANGQVAVLTEHVTVDGMDKGKPFGGEYRFLRVFAKQNGNWKVVLAQGAPMPEQGATK
jgi:ketosteroid isomerase-like protein